MELLKIKWFVIINPISGGGKVPKLWKKLSVLLENADIEFEFTETQFPKHAIELTHTALVKGVRNILIIGGDGTANEVVNGVMQFSENSEAVTIAMVSVGTGNDWVRTIGKPKSVHAIAKGLKAHQTCNHDVGVLQYSSDGRTTKRYFINIAGLGFDGHVAYKLSTGKSFFAGSKIHYWIGLLQSLFMYKHTDTTFIIDDKKIAMQTLSVAAGICRFNGGGMMQLPNADFNDGYLEMTVIGSMRKLKMVMSLPRLANGSFVNMHSVKTFKGNLLLIDSETAMHVEADGEYLGTTPVQMHILPSAIRILKWE